MITGTLKKKSPSQSPPMVGMITSDGDILKWWHDRTSANGRILAELRSAEILFANSHGMGFKGYEPSGLDRSGREVLKYQEWFITPTECLK